MRAKTLSPLAALCLLLTALLDSKELLLRGVAILDLHREDALVAIGEGDVEAAVTLSTRQFELPRNLGEFDVLGAFRVVVAVIRIDKTRSGFTDRCAEMVNSFINGCGRRFISSFHCRQDAYFTKCQEKADFISRHLLALDGKCPHEMKSNRLGGIAGFACRPVEMAGSVIRIVEQ
jgi:hypothetical protein